MELICLGTLLTKYQGAKTDSDQSENGQILGRLQVDTERIYDWVQVGQGWHKNGSECKGYLITAN